MTRMLSRPWRAATPVALAACALFMPATARQALRLAAALLLARGFSLCAGGALRAAAGRVINAARLRGNFITAFAMAVFGGAASVALCAGGAPYLKDIGPEAALAGALINLAQLFCDGLCASGDRTSPVLYDGVTAALVTAGLLISGRDSWLLPALAGLPVLAGAILTFGLRRGVSVKPGFQTLACAPGALLRGWAFPTLIVGGAMYLGWAGTAAGGALLAIGLMEGCETPFRRSPDESSAATVLCALLCAAWTACTAFAWVCAEAVAALALGCLGVMLTGAQLGLRRAGMCMLTLLCAACALEYQAGYTGLGLENWALCAAIALCAICLALAVPDIASLRRAARARRIRRRRTAG